MALLAESLVEEWLNRDGFFTIRGLKRGVEEMDLLAVRRQPDGTVVGRHVEVQVSFRPIGYIAKLTRDLAMAKGCPATSATRRNGKEIEECAGEWVRKKFQAAEKTALREKLWPGIGWEFHLVHGRVRESVELERFTELGVICRPLHEILARLSQRSGDFSGSAGGDLAELATYYRSLEMDQAPV